MAPQTTFPELVEKMKGKDTTRQWDMLVSYNEEAVNKLLAAQASSNGLLGDLKFTTTFHDGFHEEEIKVDITMSINNPYLQFSEDTSGNVTLMCPFTGSYTAASLGKQSKPFPAGMKLSIQSSLVNVSGTWDEGNKFVPAEEPSVHPPSVVVLMPHDQKVAQGICLSFTHSVYHVIGGDGGIDAWATALLKPGIEAYFSSQHLKLYLMATKTSSESQESVLQPTDFCFTIIPGDAANGHPATLCTWIGVKGGSPKGESGPQLLFQPDGVNLINPIPKENTASIIFSHNLMANGFITPQLTKALKPVEDKSSDGQDKDKKIVECKSTKGEAGMRFEATLPRKEIKVEDMHEDNGANGVCIDDKKFDGYTHYTDQPAATISFAPEIVTTTHPPVSLAWSTPEKTLEWHRTLAFYEDGNQKVGGKGFWNWIRNEQGHVKHSLALTGTARWEAPNDGLNLDFTLNFEHKWEPVEPGNWWDRCWGDNTDRIPDHYRLPQPGFDIKINMTGINYFLTTNLLFPGKHVFKASPPAVPKGSGLDHGLATPRDTILTGDVVA